MRRLFVNLKNKANAAVINAKAFFENKKAEGYVDSGVKILIAVVIGALILAGLYYLFDIVILPGQYNRISGLFNYDG